MNCEDLHNIPISFTKGSILRVAKEVGHTFSLGELKYKPKRRLNNMWVITLFETDNVRIFEYAEKAEATTAMEKFNKYAVLSYTK